MSPYKSPGIDGFQACFFQKHWSIGGQFACKMVKKVFNGGNLEGNTNCTKIVLIPKVDKPEQWSHFRPISLCNVSYKLMTKVVANRLRNIMDKVIGSMQASFVKGRHITDNIVVVQEIIHSMRK